MKNFGYILSTLFVVSILFTSCKKEFDDPVIKSIPEGMVITIADVRAMEIPGTEVHITDDISVYGVVTMDESTGNLYKESFITDTTGNLYIRFISGSGLYTGDSIRINLKGSKILRYNQMLQVDSLHPDNSIFKIATQVFKTPELLTIADLSDAFGNPLESSQGKLVQINNAWFTDKGLGLPFSDAATQTAISRVMMDANGGSIDVRTSGYANFANDTLPDGVGTFIGIVAQYNSGLQLLIRNPNELNMNGEAPIIKDFADQSVSSGGWTEQNISGAVNWSTSDLGSTGDYYGVITNTNAQLVCETWYISSGIDLSSSTSASFSFGSATFSANPDLEVYVSTDYDGVSLPATATWNLLSPTLSSGGWTWTSSGNLDLSTYLMPNVYLAFKYNGTSSAWTTWEIDDLTITK